jgi:hypothetical protein
VTKSTPTAIPTAKDDAITILEIFIRIPQSFSALLSRFQGKAAASKVVRNEYT